MTFLLITSLVLGKKWNAHFPRPFLARHCNEYHNLVTNPNPNYQKPQKERKIRGVECQEECHVDWYCLIFNHVTIPFIVSREARVASWVRRRGSRPGLIRKEIETWGVYLVLSFFWLFIYFSFKFWNGQRNRNGKRRFLLFSCDFLLAWFEGLVVCESLVFVC